MRSDSESAAYSYWRVWIEDGDVRIARDWRNAPPPGPQLQPQHLEVDGETGYVVWVSHDEGAEISSIPLTAFVAWLEQGGAS